MKFFVVIILLLSPVAATAQNQGMSGGDMQNLMLLMQKMQQCMAKIDQAELQAFKEQSEKFGNEIDTLCNNGERKKAQKKAIAYSKKMLKNPALKQMEKCGEITKGLMPEDSTPSIEDELDFSNHHVCDE